MNQTARALREVMDPARGVVVAGCWTAGGSGLFDVRNPATDAVIAKVANGDVADAQAAVDAAERAAESWRRTPRREVAEILRRAFELMTRHREELAELIVQENGKSTADALGEVAYAAEFFRWFSEEAVRTVGDFGEAPAGGARILVTSRPVGIAALVTPWNFPAAMVTRKIAPALAAGCAAVVKPAAETPLTALAVAHLLTEAGVPPGVVNVVPTLDASGVVEHWMGDPRVRKVSFTGSTGVGRLLLHQAAERVVNASMELGGNAPFIVADDADIEAAVDGAMIAKFRGGGQACTAANRIYVHESVYDRFVASFGRRVEGLIVGAGDEGADVGPLISRHAVESLDALVTAAVLRGAVISHRASVPERGSFYPPTVLVEVGQDDEILNREIFGPVAPIVRWRDDEEVIRRANETEAGLAAYVFSRDVRRGLRLAEAIDVGMVGINRGLVSDPSAPFGGTKQSGLGREGGRIGIEEFREVQYLSLDWPARDGE